MTGRPVRHRITGLLAVYAGLVSVAACALFPILWALSGSLKRQAEISLPMLL